jgi:hypothetical protein
VLEPEGIPAHVIFLLLAGGSLRAWPTTPLLRSVLVGALGDRLDVGDAVGDALLGLDAFDGRADSLSVSPLGRVAGSGAEGPVVVGDLVAAPVVLDLISCLRRTEPVGFSQSPLLLLILPFFLGGQHAERRCCHPVTKGGP